ncbi:MAG: DUF1287 domain-containing protein [Bacteroidales bacterium]|jgi:uncharacterized protein YijF (DUF1287 family)|nr:DUF1287 domain-containing protein [Bacteroidales bacterium]
MQLSVICYVGLWLATTSTPVCRDFYDTLADAALELTKDRVVYNPAYFSIPYPNGDVPARFGVCTDVVIRAYRRVGIDLQKEVHEDMSAHFDSYPKLWNASKPNSNIDHRRVPNLDRFFSRNGQPLKITADPADYLPGDIVIWRLSGSTYHIGLVSRMKKGNVPLIVHNICCGQVAEDFLFRATIVGHYRYGK